MFFSIFVFIFLGVYLGYDLKYNMKNEKDMYLKENIDNRWNLIESSIYENIDKAKIQNNFITYQLSELVVNLKNENYDIKEDLDNFLKGKDSKIRYEIDKIIKGKYINVNNDNNDPFVMVVDMKNSELYITNDNSINCATVSLVRDIELELSNHYNDKTGRIFFNNILSKSIDDVMFWNFLPNKMGYLYSVGDLAEVEKFYKHTLNFEFLDDIEFLVPLYYKEFSDILNRPYTRYGEINSAKAIVVVSGFNITDNIKNKKELYLDLNNLKNNAENYENRYKKAVATKTLLNVVLYFLIIVLYLYQDKIES